MVGCCPPLCVDLRRQARQDGISLVFYACEVIAPIRTYRAESESTVSKLTVKPAFQTKVPQILRRTNGFASESKCVGVRLYGNVRPPAATHPHANVNVNVNLNGETSRAGRGGNLNECPQALGELTTRSVYPPALSIPHGRL